MYQFCRYNSAAMRKKHEKIVFSLVSDSEQCTLGGLFREPMFFTFSDLNRKIKVLHLNADN